MTEICQRISVFIRIKKCNKPRIIKVQNNEISLQNPRNENEELKFNFHKVFDDDKDQVN
jgi:hypothetical protein